MENLIEGEDDWEADEECDILLLIGMKDPEHPEQQYGIAAPNVPKFILPTLKS